MDEFPIATIGTLGWLLAIFLNALRACIRGEGPSAFLIMPLFVILIVDVWAVGPSQLQSAHPDSHWPTLAIYSAAILPFLYFIIRFAAFSINGDNPQPNTPSLNRQNGDGHKT